MSNLAMRKCPLLSPPYGNVCSPFLLRHKWENKSVLVSETDLSTYRILLLLHIA